MNIVLILIYKNERLLFWKQTTKLVTFNQTTPMKLVCPGQCKAKLPNRRFPHLPTFLPANWPWCNWVKLWIQNEALLDSYFRKTNTSQLSTTIISTLQPIMLYLVETK